MGEVWSEDEPWEGASTAGGFLACGQHQETAAVGTCGDCGAGLCAACFDRFQPPNCPSCILSWASQRRWQILLPAIWFFGILGVAAWIAFQVEVLPPQQRMPLSWLAWILLAAYVVASLPSGWRVMGGDQGVGDDDDEGFVHVVLWAVILGAIIAPFRMIKVF